MAIQKITENPTLSAIFGKYVGQVILTSLEHDEMQIIDDIREVAKRNGIPEVRFLRPGGYVSMSIKEGRLNLHIRENDQGQWVVQDEYNYG